ncbi:MAG: GDP-L-fucose synthase family protein [Sediminibacterium sp.]
MKSTSKIYVAGHRGMVGSAIVRLLEKRGYTNLLTRTSAELDLRNQQSVNEFFAKEKPEYVFLVAAKVGGILANNTYRADFIYDNLMIQSNIIEAAYRNGVNKLLFLGSSCIYPKLAPQPLKEEYLLSGYLEPTNQSYAIAKIAGIEMCDAYRAQHGCNFISAMPTNLYGPNDNFDLNGSHVVPALLRKIMTAKEQQLDSVTIWGTGTPRREFLHVDDMADACLYLMDNYNDPGQVNIGCGEDLSILELARLIAGIVGYTGEILTDTSKPDGTPRKLMDVEKLHHMGWQHTINLQEGIERVYRDLLASPAW